MQNTNKKLLINCRNGVLDVMKGGLLPYSDEDAQPRINANFDLDAPAELWEKFLEEIFPEDAEKKDGELGKDEVLQQIFGYCLLPDCRYQKAMFLRGGGANGKNVALHALVSVIGEKNRSMLSINDLNQRFNPHIFDGKMVNVTSSAHTQSIIAFERFKEAVCGDTLPEEPKHGTSYFFNPTAKWLIKLNELPDLPDRSYRFIARSVIMLTFKRQFNQSEIDPYLSDKLDKERDGILTWAVLGLEKLLRFGGFQIPEAVEEDIETFTGLLNPVRMFMDEQKLIVDKDQEIGASELYDEYNQWCMDGYIRALSRQKFQEEIMFNFPTVVKASIGSGTRRRAGFQGIGLELKGN